MRKSEIQDLAKSLPLDQASRLWTLLDKRLKKKIQKEITQRTNLHTRIDEAVKRKKNHASNHR